MKTIKYIAIAWMLIALTLLATACSTEEQTLTPEEQANVELCNQKPTENHLYTIRYEFWLVEGTIEAENGSKRFTVITKDPCTGEFFRFMLPHSSYNYVTNYMRWSPVGEYSRYHLDAGELIDCNQRCFE